MINCKFKYSLLFLLLIGSNFLLAQKETYYYNQKNVFSIHMLANPRLIAMSNDGDDASGNGMRYGTYYNYYEDGVLKRGNEKWNLMLNIDYGRLFGGNKMVGIQFNYQKHYFTMRKVGYVKEDYNSHPSKDLKPYLISSPLFNVYDIGAYFGIFNNGFLAPNHHLLKVGIGMRIYALNKNQDYRIDKDTPINDLNKFMGNYDKDIISLRLTIGYTYRLPITKNISFDIGFNTNINLTFSKPMDGTPSKKKYKHMINGIYIPTDKLIVAYQHNYIAKRLQWETFLDFIYLKTGFSFTF